MANEIDVIVVGEQGPAGQGVPSSGTTGQFLKKNSDADFDTVWTDSSASVDSINDVNDVVITAVSDGEVLTWNNASGQWENAAPTGGGGDGTWGSITGTLSAQTDLQSALDGKANATHTHVKADISDADWITDITGSPLSELSDITITAVSTGQTLRWNGAAWVNHTLVKSDISDLDETEFAKVGNSVTDSNPDYLSNKIIGGDGVTTSTVNGGADEDLEIELGPHYLALASTGLHSGGQLSVGAATGTIDIASGEGLYVDPTSTYPTIDVQPVAIAPKTNVAITNIASQPVTYIMIDKDDNVIQLGTFPTATQKRDNIFLGVAVHSDNVNVQLVNNLPAVANSVGAQTHDIMGAFGFFNLSGNVISANGANLSINKSAGTGFKEGANFHTNPKDPHTLSMGSTILTTFRYRNQDSSEGSDVTVLDPTTYDNGGVTTVVPANNNATIQRVYIFPSNQIRIQRGQVVYASVSEAIDAVGKESFTVEPNIDENGLLLASIVVKKTATDLTDSTDGVIFTASKFGELGSVGSAAIGTLQDVYDNSINPEIVVSDEVSTAFSLKDSATNTNRDNILEVLDTSDAEVFAVTKDGVKFDNTISGLTATDVKSAIDEIALAPDDVTSVAGKTGAVTLVKADITDSDWISNLSGESIKDLSDTNASMVPTDGQVLTYDTTNGWQAEDSQGANHAFNDLTDVTLTAPSNGQQLIFNGSEWVNQATAANDLFVDGTWVRQTSSTVGTGDIELDGSVVNYIDFKDTFDKDSLIWYQITEGANWEYGKGYLRAEQVPSAARYWRLYITDTGWFSGGQTMIAEIEMRTSVGGADATVPGGAISASSRSHANQSWEKAFADDGTGSYWDSGNVGAPHWIQYDFGAGNEQAIVEVQIMAAGTYQAAPEAFKIQYSSDGAQWFDAGSETGITYASSGETREFVSTPPTADGPGRNLERTTIYKSTNSNTAIVLGGSASISTAFPPENAEEFPLIHQFDDVDDLTPVNVVDQDVLVWDNANSYWTPGKMDDVRIESYPNASNFSTPPTVNPAATGYYQLAIGWGADTSSATQDAIAIGRQTVTEGNNSVSIGTYSVSGTTGAQGGGSVAIGSGSRVLTSGTEGVAIGKAEAGLSSVAIGSGANAGTEYSIVIGKEGHANAYDGTTVFATGSSGVYAYHNGEIVFNGGGFASEPWNYQPKISNFLLKAQTTDATETLLTPRGDATTISALPQATTGFYKGQLIAHEVAGGEERNIWDIEFAVTRTAAGNITDMGISVFTQRYEDNANWTFTFGVNVTSQEWEIKVTGEAATEIYWVARLDGTTVMNAIA